MSGSGGILGGGQGTSLVSAHGSTLVERKRV